MKRLVILDLLTNKKVLKYYSEYNETQWYTEDEMYAYQLSKLSSLLRHCYENVPYYRKIIKNRNINYKSPETLDILDKFPVLTKEKIQQNYNEFYPHNYYKIRGHKNKKTGGTTGNILFKRNDANTRSSIWAAYKRYEDWMGVPDNHKTLNLMGGHVKNVGFIGAIKQKVKEFLTNSVSIDIYNTTEVTKEKIILLLQNNNISQIRSYPQFLFSVSKKLEDLGFKFKVDAISTTAEPLMLEHRKLFKKIFSAEAYDQYGCGEIGGIAFECNHHNGLHIAEERVITEVKANNEILVTDLDNYTMPFIRYRNADQVNMSKKKCSCGRKSKLIKNIMGRTCDYVVGVNNQFLHWAYFWHLLFDSNINNIRKFQIIQYSNKNIVIRMVSEEMTEGQKAFIISDIKKRLGDINVAISYDEEIENTATGKYRPVIKM